MRTTLLLLIAGISVAARGVRAQRPSLVVAGGMSIPVGDDRVIRNGANATVGLNFGRPPIPLGMRIEAGINTFNFNAARGLSGNRRVVTVTANGTLMYGAPYLIGGVGYYHTSGSNTGTGNSLACFPAPDCTATTRGTSSTLGVNGGVGYRIPLRGITSFAEVRYHRPLLAFDRGGHFIPILLGVAF